MREPPASWCGARAPTGWAVGGVAGDVPAAWQSPAVTHGAVADRWSGSTLTRAQTPSTPRTHVEGVPRQRPLVARVVTPTRPTPRAHMTEFHLSPPWFDRECRAGVIVHEPTDDSADQGVDPSAAHGLVTGRGYPPDRTAACPSSGTGSRQGVSRETRTPYRNRRRSDAHHAFHVKLRRYQAPEKSCCLPNGSTTTSPPHQSHTILHASPRCTPRARPAPVRLGSRVRRNIVGDHP